MLFGGPGHPAWPGHTHPSWARSWTGSQIRQILTRILAPPFTMWPLAISSNSLRFGLFSYETTYLQGCYENNDSLKCWHLEGAWWEDAVANTSAHRSFCKETQACSTSQLRGQSHLEQSLPRMASGPLHWVAPVRAQLDALCPEKRRFLFNFSHTWWRQHPSYGFGSWSLIWVMLLQFLRFRM